MNARKGRVIEAAIEGGMRSCDVCGRADRIDRFVSIYYGPRGEKIDLCPRCLKEGRLNAGQR